MAVVLAKRRSSINNLMYYLFLKTTTYSVIRNFYSKILVTSVLHFVRLQSICFYCHVLNLFYLDSKECVIFKIIIDLQGLYLFIDRTNYTFSKVDLNFQNFKYKLPKEQWTNIYLLCKSCHVLRVPTY